MIVFPAVDIKDGCCVRLEKGRPETAKKYYDEPWRAARQWEAEGAGWLHVVDLDGALSKSSQNSPAVENLLAKSNLKVQVGGGIRGKKDIDKALSAGASRVVIGTIAAREPDRVIRQSLALPGRLVIALDSEDGMVSVKGWKQSSGITVEELANTLQEGRPAAFLYTDIQRDGMLSHPDLKGIETLLKCTESPVIASGGVSSIDDIKALGKCGADGVIIGKALYEGRFKLCEALEAAARYDSRLD